MLIGVGPHSLRVYLPLIKQFEAAGLVSLVGVVDLLTQKEKIERELSTHNFVNKLSNLFINSAENLVDSLHINVVSQLNKIVSQAAVKGVIIATEPLTHKAYANWALDVGISVLLDKPISTHKNVSTSVDKANMIFEDFSELNEKYLALKKHNSSICFLVMAQRRYHSSYNLIRAAISDVYNKTNCPVTYVNTFHSDGQWRTPHEIMTQLYHPYFQGYGKGSHSGYHYFDIIPYMISAGIGNDKSYDAIDVFSTFVRPSDFLAQFNIADHSSILGSEFSTYHKQDSEFFANEMSAYGEVDLNSSISFKKGKDIITQVSINLLHNGVSQRDWAHVGGRDLYKGVGRVLHEMHVIEQGPFQSIQFHSYKGQLKGGEYGSTTHLDVVIYRNSKLLGGQHVTKYTLDDFRSVETINSLGSSPAKRECFSEFIAYMSGEVIDVKSDLTTHVSTALLTRAIYLSAANRYQAKNPLVSTEFGLPAYTKVDEKILNLLEKKLGSGNTPIDLEDASLKSAYFRSGNL